MSVVPLSRNVWVGLGLAAGMGFLAYCVYFDRKRRSHPDFKKKLREKRRKAQEEKKKAKSKGIPNITDPIQMQQYFLQEVQLGEELLASGQDEEAMEHLKNAIILCGRPQQLLQIFEQQLTPAQFKLLVDMLPTSSASESAPASASSQVTATVSEIPEGAAVPVLEEQDLE